MNADDYEWDDMLARAETAEANERTLRVSWAAACKTANELEREVERLTRTKREAKVQFDETTDGLRAEVELLTDDRDRWKAVSKDHRRVIDSRGEQIVSLTEQVESCRAEVERLTHEKEALSDALDYYSHDADGNALVTVRVSDLDWMVSCFGLMEDPRWMRLRRALDEREDR